MLLTVAASEDVIQQELVSLFVIMAIAAFVPILLGLFRIRIAEVVFLLGFGVLLGPYVAGWIEIDAGVSLVAEIGLGFLFFFAGLELEPEAVRGRSGKLAAIGWGVSMLIAAALSVVLNVTGVLEVGVGFAIVLTSTALGTLLPTFRDAGLLNTNFGKYFMAAGAWGELGPIVAIAVFLGSRNPVVGVIALFAFGALALIASQLPKLSRHEALAQIIRRGFHTSSQTLVRLSVLFLIGLLAIAGWLGLDVVLGAFVAGIIVRRYMPSEDELPLASKVEAVGFGFFIPAFFVISGARIDVQSLLDNPWPLFIVLGLLLVVRGVPQFFVYRGAIPEPRERARLSLYIATGLPIIVAVTTIQVNAGIMTSAQSALLVGAGALSVLIFPLVASWLAPRRSSVNH